MIEIINKDEGDVCSQRIMCFHQLTDNTFCMAAIWVSTGVAAPRPDWFFTSPLHPHLYFYTSDVSQYYRHARGNSSVSQPSQSLNIKHKSNFPQFYVALKGHANLFKPLLHSLCWDSPGRLTSIHPSSSASVTQGLGPFSSAATSSTSPNNRLLRRWNMTCLCCQVLMTQVLFVVHQEKAVAALLNFLFVFIAFLPF